MLSDKGKVTYTEAGKFELVRTYFEKPATLLVGLRNTSNSPMEMSLDCSESTNLLCSVESCQVSKRVGAQELVWMMNCEANVTCEEFTLATSVSYA
jgi:hypothetical protein